MWCRRAAGGAAGLGAARLKALLAPSGCSARTLILKQAVPFFIQFLLSVAQPHLHLGKNSLFAIAASLGEGT